MALMGHAHRERKANHCGRRRVFVTAYADLRRALFRDHVVSEFVSTQLLKHVGDERIEASTYCVMPDHVHVLLQGLSATSDPGRAIFRWKQSTGHWFRCKHADRLWQGSYWDYVLREDEDPLFFTHYSVMDPVRSGLVRTPDEYQWIGSSRWSRAELVEKAVLYEKRALSCGRLLRTS
jgi:REP element-mobilizing transposase RayT